MDLTEKTIESVNVFKGVVVDLYVDTVVLPDGTTAKREVINHPGGVCILAVDENLDVLIVKQFRKAPDGVMTEIPAGISVITASGAFLNCLTISTSRFSSTARTQTPPG